MGLKKFDANEEVEGAGQKRMTSTQKEDSKGMKVKAGLMVQGYQEDEEPRIDSPTLAKEFLKVDIKETSKGIKTYQRQNCNSIQEIKIMTEKDPKQMVTKKENK